MLYFNYNGKILKEHTPIAGPDNRGLRYGDGLFETIKYKDAQLVLPDEHFARLWKGLQLLQFEIPKLFTAEMLQSSITQLVQKNNLATARIRVSVIRGDGGLYDAKSHAPQYIIQCWPLPENHARLNENGLQLCLYKEARKSIDAFCNLKHNNYLPYIMGALHAKKNHCNDALVYNSHNRICDTTIANVFIIKNGLLYTAALAEGCVAGVTRKCIIQTLSGTEYHVSEIELTEDLVLDADEVFTCNAMYNIRWVDSIAHKKYSNHHIRKIYEFLRATNPVVFC